MWWELEETRTSWSLLGWLVFAENGIAGGTSWKGIRGCGVTVHLLYRAVASEEGNLTSLLFGSPPVSVATGVSLLKMDSTRVWKQLLV